jgi:hypothetical protein
MKRHNLRVIDRENLFYGDSLELNALRSIVAKEDQIAVIH